MSTPKLIRVYSPGSKSQNNKQTCCTQAPPDRSSLDTEIMNQKTSQMQNYYSLLIDQVKRLSRDNDKMWKLLTQTEEQHNECNKVQKKLKQNLQCAEKQLSMMKQMYSVQKSNFQQSKSFFQNREKQWQGIVSELKKVIQDYQSTNSIDMQRASHIFNQTNQIKSQKQIDKLPNFDKQLSIYSRRNENHQRQSEIDQQIYSKYSESNQENIQSNINQKNDGCSIMSSASKRNRSKIFKAKFLANKVNNSASQSAKKICQKIYAQEVMKMEYHQSNPEDAYELLTMQDIFQRSLRKTYVKYRSVDQKAYDILYSPHMEKLKTAKSSTKQRLSKTIRKVFVVDSSQQLEDVIKYIEDRVYKKYRLLKGQLIFKFLEDKFKECQQIFQSSNSALDRLDKEPSNFINGVTINSKFKDFQQKRKQIRSNDSKSLRYTQMLTVDQMYGMDNQSQCSKATSSQMGLSINSNIKDKNTLTHINNHMKNQLEMGSEKLVPEQRDHSRKNIYTEKRLSRRNFVEQLSRTNKSSSIQNSIVDKNLSSLIGASQQYELKPGNMSNKNTNSSGKGIYHRTNGQSQM